MAAVTRPTAVEDSRSDSSRCWCCGVVDDPFRMIHLGNHPEVILCVRCGRWAGKQAWEIEDRDRAGVSTVVRDRFRAARRRVVQRGWHHNRVFGPVLRWVGRFLP